MPPRKKLSEVLAQDGQQLLHEQKEPQTIFQTMLREEAEQQAEQEAQEINEDDKPPYRAYNSQLGTITLTKGDKKFTYHHGERMPDGKTAQCPKFSFYEHVKTYTRLIDYKKEIDPTTKQEYQIKVETPLELNSLQVQIANDFFQYRCLLVLVFRGFGKSTLGQEFSKEEIENWGKSLTYISKSSELTVDYANAIRNEFMINPRIKRDYGYLLDDERGNSKSKMFFMSQRGSASKEPGICIGTSDGKSTLGGHPEIIICDDIVDDDAANSDKERKRISRFFWKAIYPMLTPQSKIIVIGTMKHPKDLYNEIAERGMFKVIKIPAILEWPNHGQILESDNEADPSRWGYVFTKSVDNFGKEVTLIGGVRNIEGGKASYDEYNKKLWKEAGRIQYYLENDPTKGIDKNRMAMQEFLLVRKAQGVAFFQSEYQLEAVSVEKGYLNFDAIWRFNFAELARPIQDDLDNNITAFYDQAFGTGNTVDWNAIVVVSRSNLGSDLVKYYIRAIEVWKGGGVGKKVAMLRTLKQRFKKLEFIGIDAGQINSVDVLYIQNNCPDIPIHPVYEQQLDAERERLGITVEKVNYVMEGVKPGKLSKCRRILNQLDSKMSNRQIGMANDISADGLTEWNAEQSFPFCDKFDVMDSTGMAVEMADRFNPITDFFWKHG